jgi:hypothetical protein
MSALQQVPHRLVRVKSWPAETPYGIQVGVQDGNAVVWNTHFERQKVDPSDLVGVSYDAKEQLSHACTNCKAPVDQACIGNVGVCYGSNRGELSKMANALNNDE